MHSYRYEKLHIWIFKLVNSCGPVLERYVDTCTQFLIVGTPGKVTGLLGSGTSHPISPTWWIVTNLDSWTLPLESKARQQFRAVGNFLKFLSPKLSYFLLLALLTFSTHSMHPAFFVIDVQGYVHVGYKIQVL
jgi:hypothetical protein